MFLLTKDGVPKSSIILGNEATWLERHAAEELQDYIKKISDAKINIIEESLSNAVEGNKILIGLSSKSNSIKTFDKQYAGILPKESNNDNDCIAYVLRENTLVISGSNERSVYYSVCHLLQREFGVGFYWDRDVYVKNPSLYLSDSLTWIERSPFKIRHSIGQWVYNHGAFLNEEERCAELDKLARNKINSYRLYNWNSYARKKAFIELGLKGYEITQEDIARRDCVRSTIEYARKLGIEVMVPLISGETSLEFLKIYPDSRYFGCEWVKDDNATPQTMPYLYPEDPMYKMLIQTYVKVWIEAYGSTNTFVCSPPSEHHIATEIDDFIEINIDFAKYTYEALYELNPNVQLYYDGWGVRANTPPSIWSMSGVMQRFVENLPERVIFLDLWPNREEYGSNFAEPMYRDEIYKPLRKSHYVLEILNEFGGDDHMHGNFADQIEAANEMLDTQMVDNADGFGNCTELCGVNLFFFDLIFQLAWNPKQITLDSFLNDSARRRYGNLPNEIGVKAMHDLQQSVYGYRKSAHARYQKRCYLIRPQRTPAPISESLEVIAYLDDFMQIMTSLPDKQKNDAIGQDMYDVMRQYITEYFNLHMGCLLSVFLHRSKIEKVHLEFEKHASILDKLLTQLECMTKENTTMYIETIVRQLQGRPCDPDISGADCSTPVDFRAWMRDMGTTFVRSIPNLPDYDSQDYHELICHYYHPRVSKCIEILRSLLDDHGKTSPQIVDDLLEQGYKIVEDHWIDIGYPVANECKNENLPLWKAAQNAWNALHDVSLNDDLVDYDDSIIKEAVDVFASFPENTEPVETRSWVDKNPFAINKRVAAVE